MSGRRLVVLTAPTSALVVWPIAQSPHPQTSSSKTKPHRKSLSNLTFMGEKYFILAHWDKNYRGSDGGMAHCIARQTGSLRYGRLKISATSKLHSAVGFDDWLHAACPHEALQLAASDNFHNFQAVPPFKLANREFGRRDGFTVVFDH